jgi:Cu-Zn family superoxide dismutase
VIRYCGIFGKIIAALRQTRGSIFRGLFPQQPLKNIHNLSNSKITNMKILTTGRLFTVAALFFVGTFFAACNATKHAENRDGLRHAQATLSGTYPDTTVTGTATFDQKNGKVKMVLSLIIPAKANKSVAVHLHEHGDCGDMGKGAHGHWNPTNKKHGKWGSAEFHLGDIGNVQLDGQGKGSLTLETNLWTIGGDSTSNILGRAVIVHGGVDDYVSQPAGNAGTRIGCGVIQ